MNNTRVKPLVSVVITVRNAEDYISATLASILQEQEIPLEVVLIDNGCTDTTIERVRAFRDERVRIIEGPRKGIAHALNVAYSNLRGEIVMRCDGDDLFPPQRLVKQVKWLQEHPEFGAVCSGYTTIDPKGKAIANLVCDRPSEEITEELRNGIVRTHIGTFAIRAEVVHQAGGSREYFDCFEDFDFQLRISETCRVGFVPEDHYHYRLHHNSSTHTTGITKREFYDQAAFEFQRQRRTRGQDDLQLGCPPPIPEDGILAPMKANEQMMGMLLGSAWLDHQAGRKWAAMKKGVRCILLMPNDLGTWRNLLVLALKPTGKKVGSAAFAKRVKG